MKKLIVLLSGVIIAAGAAAQTGSSTTGSSTTGSSTTGAAQPTLDRQAPVTGERGKRENPAQEHEDSANSVSTDFQGSSKQDTTASGMGHVKKDKEHTSKTKKTESNVQDVEDKTKK